MLPEPSSTEPAPTTSRYVWLALALITLAGLVLRWLCAGESLWLDELHTGWVVKDGWGEVAWRAQIGNQSPLWFYAVKVVTTLGGESEVTLRLLSLIAGTALIPATFWLVRVFTSAFDKHDFAGLVAAALVAIDPHCIFYASEARPYACLQLSAAIQLGLFWQVLQQPTTRLRLAWVALTALAFHLHYTGILMVLGELAALVAYYVLSRQTMAYRPWRALFDWQLVAILCLPAIGHVLEVGRRREMWSEMSQQPGLSELRSMFPLQATVVLGLLACGFAAVEFGSRGRRAEPQAGWTAVGTIAFWFVLPLLAAWSAAHFDLARMFVRRYLVAVAIGPVMLMSLLLIRIPWRWLQYAAAVAVLGYAVNDSSMIANFRESGLPIAARGEDWRGAIAWLRERYPEHPARVMVDAHLVEDSDNFFQQAGESAEQWDRRLRAQAEYRCFPLRSLYSAGVAEEEIWPWSLYYELRGPLDPSEDPPEFWFVSRSHDELPHPWTSDSKALMLLTMTATEHEQFSGVSVWRLKNRSR